MTDLFKAAAANQWTTQPTFAVGTFGTGAVIKQSAHVRALADANAELMSMLVVPFDPVTGNYGAGATGNVHAVAVGQGGVTGNTPPSGSVGTYELNFPQYWNAGAANYDYAEEATATATVVLPSGTSTQILAAVAGKKYKLFHIFLSASNVAGAVTINEATSGTILAGCNGVAAGAGQTANLSFLPNGVLQPTANNAIQVTTAGAQLGYASLVYGAAR